MILYEDCQVQLICGQRLTVVHETSIAESDTKGHCIFTGCAVTLKKEIVLNDFCVWNEIA